MTHRGMVPLDWAAWLRVAVWVPVLAILVCLAVRRSR